MDNNNRELEFYICETILTQICGIVEVTSGNHQLDSNKIPYFSLSGQDKWKEPTTIQGKITFEFLSFLAELMLIWYEQQVQLHVVHTNHCAVTATLLKVAAQYVSSIQLRIIHAKHYFCWKQPSMLLIVTKELQIHNNSRHFESETLHNLQKNITSFISRKSALHFPID